MRTDDLIICIAYFSIPVQLVWSLYQYPRLAQMPLRVLILIILFALFIVLCGFGHMMRCLDAADGTAFLIVNRMTSFISLATALYLLPLVPSLMSDLDSSLQDLVKLNEETAESKRKLFTFMAFLCHEIRNPLFAITSNIEFAQDMDMSPEMDTALNAIHQSTTLMLRLVNDVLDLSKIESGKLELEDQEFDVHDFFSNVATSMSSQIQHKRQGNVNFVFNIAHNVPRLIISDSVRLLQIAYNILSNASKFTEEGSITFSVSLCDLGCAIRKGYVTSPQKHEQDGKQYNSPRCQKHKSYLAFNDETASESDSENMTEVDDSEDHETDVLVGGRNKVDDEFSMALLQSEEGCAYCTEDGEETVIKVLKLKFEDTGPGIPTDRIERIFQPYAQSKLSDFRKHGGTGLGLSIIKKLIEIMGGSIHVHSVEDVGSKFVVHLPVRVPKKQNDRSRRRSFATTQELVDNHGLEEAGDMGLKGNVPHQPKDLLESRSTASPGEEVLPTQSPRPTIARSSSTRSVTTKIDHVTPKNPAPLFAMDVCLDAPPSKALFHLAPTVAPPPQLPPSNNTKRNISGTNPSTGQLCRNPPPETASNSTPSSALFNLAPPTIHSTTVEHDCQPIGLFSTESATNLIPKTLESIPPLSMTSNAISKTSSKPDDGTTAKAATTSTTRRKPPPLPKFDFEKNTNFVLVVDDNCVNRKLLGKMLSFFNIEYDQAENGQIAVDIMSKSRNATGDPSAPMYGLVLMDLCMPVCDGYQAIELIRKQGLDLPIIALTANALAEGRQKAMDAGATEFATKPILRPILHAKCAKYLPAQNASDTTLGDSVEFETATSESTSKSFSRTSETD